MEKKMEDNRVKIKPIKLGFLGDSPVGKTAIIYSILGQEFVKILA